ncbi:Os10g0141050 [Oryza sativa Japonica Group]|uniref:Os10g0141050 protein n=1 Tax=Oryza sativa subsp. japonica TaxID=39947 RepID=A0A0P0XRE3_ORYSJ|nr:Os10g0141050 [Oryza sativa Japonica Group]
MFVGFVFVMSSIRTTPKLYTSLFGVRRAPPMQMLDPCSRYSLAHSQLDLCYLLTESLIFQNQNLCYLLTESLIFQNQIFLHESSHPQEYWTA